MLLSQSSVAQDIPGVQKTGVCVEKPKRQGKSAATPTFTPETMQASALTHPRSAIN